MLAVIHDPNKMRVLWLHLQHRDGRTPDEYLPFLKEQNLKDMFPEAEWQGRAQPGARMTYTASWMSAEEVAALGNRLYENVFEADEPNEFPAGEFPPQANVGMPQ